MVISLIGMSGSGKTYWSGKLEQKGFKRICCDDLIEEKLFQELKSCGQAGLRDVARWMGQPFDKRYPETSKKYIECERQVMDEILAGINSEQNSVIDTTGSVIYLNKEILDKLAKATWVIYLETPEKYQKIMYKLYLDDPKPVYWGKSFSRREGETNMEALARCYPNLLALRIRQYGKLADITLPYETLQRPGFGIDDFLSLIKK